MAYATGADLMDRVDNNLLNSLVTDGTEELSLEDLADSDVVATALEDASGDIDVALVAGKRYTAANLAALTGNSLALLKRIVCSLAMVYLLERRRPANVEKLEGYEARARDAIRRLRLGENVFGIEENVSATNPTMGGPTAFEYSHDINTVVDRAGGAGRYYPSRSQRLPVSRG